MSKQVILNQAFLEFIGEFGLPDKIMSELEERLRQVDWNELLKPVLSGIPARIHVVDATGPERVRTQQISVENRPGEGERPAGNRFS